MTEPEEQRGTPLVLATDRRRDVFNPYLSLDSLLDSAGKAQNLVCHSTKGHGVGPDGECRKDEALGRLLLESAKRAKRLRGARVVEAAKAEPS